MTAAINIACEPSPELDSPVGQVIDTEVFLVDEAWQPLTDEAGQYEKPET